MVSLGLKTVIQRAGRWFLIKTLLTFATSMLILKFQKHGNFRLINCPSLLKVEGEIKNQGGEGI